MHFFKVLIFSAVPHVSLVSLLICLKGILSMSEIQPQQKALLKKKKNNYSLHHEHFVQLIETRHQSKILLLCCAISLCGI